MIGQGEPVNESSAAHNRTGTNCTAIWELGRMESQVNRDAISGVFVGRGRQQKNNSINPITPNADGHQ